MSKILRVQCIQCGKAPWGKNCPINCLYDEIIEKLQLTEAGPYWLGKCPFKVHIHDKKHDFALSRNQNKYYCFMCKKGGNANNLQHELKDNDDEGYDKKLLNAYKNEE